MDANLPCVFLLLVFSSIEQSTARNSLFSTGSLSQPQRIPPTMPAGMFSKMRNMSSTEDFLRDMNLYQQEKQKGVLPEQIKNQTKLKSRSSGGNPYYTELINFDQQTCVVRPHIHFLEQPPQHENAFIWPHAVQISQCAGSCNVRQDIMTCRPANKILIPLRAYWVPYHSSRKRRDVMDEIANLKDPIHELSKRSTGGYRPINVAVEADVDCHCECTATEELCAKQNKKLNKHLCRCQCKTVDTNCNMPFRWDEQQCKCLCNEDRMTRATSCHRDSGGKKRWDHGKCACLCTNSINCPSATNTFDTNTCTCECAANATCPANQSLRYGTAKKFAKMCYCK